MNWTIVTGNLRCNETISLSGFNLFAYHFLTTFGWKGVCVFFNQQIKYGVCECF
jgi:hypothetical protein